jgi:hypothetical protein
MSRAPCHWKSVVQGRGFDYVFSTDGIRLRTSIKNEAVQMERAASTPTMSTIKSVTTLAITFTSIYDSF